MDTDKLKARLQELLDGGGGEPAGSGPDRFVPLVELDSGARCGLDREARWVLVPADGARSPARYTEGAAHLFHEALEWKRSRFDDAIEAAARAQGLPVDDVLWSFPAVEVIRAVLTKHHAYLTRLALEWIRPSELRALRAEIRAAAQAPNLPVPVTDLAERLIVPE